MSNQAPNVPELWWSAGESAVYADRECAAPRYIRMRDTRHFGRPADSVKLGNVAELEKRLDMVLNSVRRALDWGRVSERDALEDIRREALGGDPMSEQTLAVFPYRQHPHEFCGSDTARQEVGDPGHCEDCCSAGHVVAHPDLGCGDVGCYLTHGPDPEHRPGSGNELEVTQDQCTLSRLGDRRSRGRTRPGRAAGR